jgi:aminocarboxymuconate-semialdehyde decarboxylase
VFVSCAMRAPVPEGGRSGGSGPRPGPVIDLHCHWESNQVMDRMHAEADRLGKVSLTVGSELTRQVNRRQMAEIRPQMESVDVRLADMDRMGVDIQAVAHFPPQMYYWADPEVAADVFPTMNDDLAELVATHPDRLMGMGNLPLQDTELAIAELARCMDDLGFRGIQISTRVENEELSAPRLEPLWDEVERRGTVVVIHSSGHDNQRRLDHHYLINVVGHPIEGAMAASHLIFSGVMERHPDLKIVLVHGGGYLPPYAARMDHAYHAREDVREGLPLPPTEYLKRFYLDTMVFAEDQLGFLIDKYGADHIVLGTDYPYDMGETDPVGLITRTVGADATTIAAIAGGNAARLLGLS